MEIEQRIREGRMDLIGTEKPRKPMFKNQMQKNEED